MQHVVRFISAPLHQLYKISFYLILTPFFDTEFLHMIAFLENYFKKYVRIMK